MNKLFKSITSTMLVLTLLLALFVTTIPTEVHAASALNATSKTLNLGKSFTLKVTGSKAKKNRFGETYYEYTYKGRKGYIFFTSFKDSVATVNYNTGKITAKKAGTTTVIAQFSSNDQYYRSMDIGKCKITVKHTHDLKTVTKEATIYEDGSITTTCSQKGCSYKKTEKIPYQYNKQEVYDLIDNGMHNFSRYYYEFDKKFGYDPAQEEKHHPSEFIEWAVKNGYYDKAILEIDKKQKCLWDSSPNEYDCSSSAYIVAHFLGGYNRYECISYDPDEFDYSTLMPGDVLLGPHHVEVFVCWKYLEPTDGGHFKTHNIPVTDDVHDWVDKYGIDNIYAETISNLSGSSRKLGVSEYGTIMDGPSASILWRVYRLKNYK